MEEDDLKPLFWIASSLDDLRSFLRAVREDVGFALFQAQAGGKHVDAKPLKGFGGSGVIEVVTDDDGNTFRAVYTVKFKGVVYVLHAFQKKSKQGIKTPQHDTALIRSRLALHSRITDDGGRTMNRLKKRNGTTVARSSGNVFADLKLPEAAEVLTKARVAHEICELIRREGLNQTEAAARLGIDQPKVSSLMRGKLQGFSLDRLLHFITALGQDVDIVIHPSKSRSAQIRIAVPA